MQYQRFQLRRSTIAIVDNDNGKKVATMIPAGAVIMALGLDPLECAARNRTEQIEVSWNGRSMSMFLIDLQERGERVLAV
jgi:hypothetical protein